MLNSSSLSSSSTSAAPFRMAVPVGGGGASAGAVVGTVGYGDSHCWSHAVARSDEFLSCAKTAVKVATRRNATQSNQPHETSSPSFVWWRVDVEELRLHDATAAASPYSMNPHLEESIELLRGMDGDLQALEGLVRRRGHTNDPTEEIHVCTERLQKDTKELLEAVILVVPKHSRGQAQRHYQLVSDWIKGAAQEQGVRLQRVLKTRAAVLAEQAQRRKMFTTTTTSTTASGSGSHAPLSLVTTSSAALSRSNPLFTIPAPTVKPKPPLPHPLGARGPTGPSTTHSPASSQQISGRRVVNGGGSAGGDHSGSNSTTTTTTNAFEARNGAPGSSSASSIRPLYGGVGASTGSYYGAGYGYGGNNNVYYGAANGSSSAMSAAASGMRQRRPVASTSRSAAATAALQDSSYSHQPQHHEQERLLVRQQERQAQERLREARQAESSLVELGTLFGKMSQLISTQGEIVAKIEDDVEAAHVDVQLGHGEIQTLYGIKKGNRGLILKTFGLLIFFIIFMRLYKSK